MILPGTSIVIRAWRFPSEEASGKAYRRAVEALHSHPARPSNDDLSATMGGRDIGMFRCRTAPDFTYSIVAIGMDADDVAPFMEGEEFTPEPHLFMRLLSRRLSSLLDAAKRGEHEETDTHLAGLDYRDIEMMHGATVDPELLVQHPGPHEKCKIPVPHSHLR